LDRRVSPYSSSFEIEELDVHLDDESVLALIFKNLSSEAMLDDARRAKPAFLFDPEREIDVYQETLDAIDVGAPRLYGSVADPLAGRYWLFLERIDGSPLSQVGDWGIWIQAARSLAEMHAQFRAHPGRWPRRAIRYDECFYRSWPERATLALGNRSALASVLTSYEAIMGRLASMERSLIHGELYPSNVLVAQAAGAPRVCLIDWEMAAIGPKLMDLAALTAGQWTEDQRATLVRAYRAGAIEASEPVGSEAELFNELACCRLHLALQWLGWSTSWKPPPEQAHDWLSEALGAAASLGLS